MNSKSKHKEEMDGRVRNSEGNGNSDISAELPSDENCSIEEACAIQSGSKEEMTEAPDEKSEKDLSAVESAAKEKSIDQLKAEYEEKISGLEDRFLRLAAEFDNYKKRINRRIEEIIKNSSESIIVQILEVLDNFERALKAASESTDFSALREGTGLIYQNLLEILKKEGLEPIEALGRQFDPGLHEAVMQIESDEYPEGVIAGETTRGYKLNGKVIRFSKVVVSKGIMEQGKDSE